MFFRTFFNSGDSLPNMPKILRPSWLAQAHEQLTDRPVPDLRLKYSGRFKGYNANVRYGRGWMEFKLSRKWEPISEEIQMGCVQHLLCKVYGLKDHTMYIDMYEDFLKQLSTHAPKDNIDEFLAERFLILNEEYFAGLMDLPNLEWGSFSTTRLGTYDYATDTVRLSTALKDDLDMLDYVLYHELLHKKHKFSCSSGRTRSHTPAFRADEAKFRVPDAERKLELFLRGQRRVKRARKAKKPERRKSLLARWLGR